MAEIVRLGWVPARGNRAECQCTKDIAAPHGKLGFLGTSRPTCGSGRMSKW